MRIFIQSLTGSIIGVIAAIIFLCFCCIVCCFVLFLLLFSGNNNLTMSRNINFTPVELSYISKSLSDQIKIPKNKILILDINGIILTDKSNEFVSLLAIEPVVYAQDVVKAIDTIKTSNDKTWKAILLRINSPGGTAVGGELISKALADIQDNLNIPVYAYISDLGASAAYMIASVSKNIYVGNSSLVGSIGITLGTIPYYKGVRSINDITTREDVEFYTFYAGKGKDFGNSFRKITEEEISHYNKILQNSYDSFLKFVSNSRGIDINMLKDSIGAYLFDGYSAIEKKLADQIGTEQDVVNKIIADLQLNPSETQFFKVNQNVGLFASLFASINETIKSQNQSKINRCPLVGTVLYLHGDPLQYCKL